MSWMHRNVMPRPVAHPRRFRNEYRCVRGPWQPVLAGSLLWTWLIWGFATPVAAGDWARFRGPNGSGVSAEEAAPPVTWDAQQNIKWKVDLPGPGLSSPIVVGQRVLLTCWSGYGTEASNSQNDLRRHLLCIDRTTGQTLWQRTVEPTLPEDEFGGMFAENGYASHSPVSDGERVYVFFGKTGALAFDLDGNQLWHAPLGTESDPRGWGSAASPILHEELLIVTASAESEALVALNKRTGEQVWRKEASGFSGTWGTPVLVQVDDSRTDLVVSVPGELWAFDPASGKLRWYCEAPTSNPVSASAIAHEGIVYVIGARQGGSIAVRAGGDGDVSQSHVVWTGNDRIGVGTPLYHDERLYWVASGVATCVDASTGQRIYQSRLGRTEADTEANVGEGQEGRRAGFGGGRGGGGGMRGQDYSSPVAVADKLYFVSRSGVAHVLALGPEFRQLASNTFAEADEQFSASPAISDGELFIRSNRRLYCIAQLGEPQ
jgi:outer membrane protein assembly factor BamB